ncbi:hypothetical protein JCM11641_008408 [Rhodosporidiobolus odoratus]
MLAYALPLSLSLGIVGAVAIAVVLVEVVPRVLEERQRLLDRREWEGRRQRVPVRARGRREAKEEKSVARGSGIEPKTGWGFEVRKRKGRRQGTAISEPEAQHVLGGDPTDLEENVDDDDLPLSRFSAPPTSTTPVTTHPTPPALTPVPTGTTTRSSGGGTEAFFSPDLASEVAAAPTFIPLLSDSEVQGSAATLERSPTLVSSPISDADSTFASPALPSFFSPSAASTSTFASPSLPDDPFSDRPSTATKPSKTTGAVTQEEKTETTFDRPSDSPFPSPAPSSVSDGWARSPALSVTSSTEEDGNGWTRLSDSGSEEGEWAKVPRSKIATSAKNVGLGREEGPAMGRA